MNNLFQLQTDLVQAYQQIKQMCREFRRNQQRPKSHDQEEENEIPKPQRLMDTLGELRELMYDIMSPKSMVCFCNAVFSPENI